MAATVRAAKPKVRRRRKGFKRAKRGFYTSTKTGRTHEYRSGWEARYFAHLDADPSILTWDYESLRIPYVSNTKSIRMRTYIPDLLVERSDGTKALIEIKPARKVDQAMNVKKFAAARFWCAERGMTFEVVTEVELKALGLM